jgi:hypothetical protein
MENSNEFMLLFRFEPDFSQQPTEEQLAEMHSQWGSYLGGLAIQEKLISTHQLGFEGAIVSADQSTSEGIVIADNQTLGGNLVIKASSMAEAIEVAKSCPILGMGGNVEIRNILPM